MYPVYIDSWLLGTGFYFIGQLAWQKPSPNLCSMRIMGISCHIQPYTHALHIHKCTHTQTHMQVKIRSLFVLLKEYVTHMKAS